MVAEVAEPAEPDAAPSAQRLWFARLLDRARLGAELSVPQAYLHGERDTPMPTPTPSALPKPPLR